MKNSVHAHSNSVREVTGHLSLDLPLWFTTLLPNAHHHMVCLLSFAGTLDISMTCCPVVWFAPCYLWIVLCRGPQQVQGGHLSVAWHCIQGICLLRPRFALVAVLGSQLSCIQLDIGDGRTTRGILSPTPSPPPAPVLPRYLQKPTNRHLSFCSRTETQIFRGVQILVLAGLEIWV